MSTFLIEALIESCPGRPGAQTEHTSNSSPNRNCPFPAPGGQEPKMSTFLIEVLTGTAPIPAPGGQEPNMNTFVIASVAC